MRPSWSSLPKRSGSETPAVYALLALCGIVFLIDFYTHNALGSVLVWPVNSLQWFASLHYWQPFTFPFVHFSQIFYLLTDGLVLYFFGSSLERSWGSGRFLFFFFATGLLAGLIVLALSPLLSGGLMVGMVGSLVAMVVAFAALNPYATVVMFIFPLQARWLAALAIVFEIFGRTGTYGSPATTTIAVLAVTAFSWAFTTNRLALRGLSRHSGPSFKERFDHWQQRRRMRRWQRRVSRIERPDDLFKDK
ncbi:MAG: hypothetical protein DLM53_09275 [Candidatus Eremiobacter antarcticus]|nr:rhomboid family intramembrane serine protease [Candidatus Eremiobacteraeota bacterium]MBC5807538.1 rhomboid family intramembrane serine protease [Candidatus Eremiobacteraeota bacterium]PZR61410.1 MAG: hypothetical protein DLM53_09275 [Candidatus Eremiobacter sp. RRmetagenome_bin22]